MGEIDKVTVLTRQSEEEAPRDAAHPDWRKAFIVLTLALARGWVNSDQFAGYVDAVRAHCGDEIGDFMVAVFNKFRPSFVQDIMG